jgi:hypothetical protein
MDRLKSNILPVPPACQGGKSSGVGIPRPKHADSAYWKSPLLEIRGVSVGSRFETTHSRTRRRRPW